MKIYKKSVKNKEYLIAKDRIFLSNGNTEIVSKSFGLSGVVENLSEKKRNFVDALESEEEL